VAAARTMNWRRVILSFIDLAVSSVAAVDLILS